MFTPRPRYFAPTVGLVVVGALCSSVVARAAVVIPTQWIVKQYSEALGRAPDANGWQDQVSFFSVNDCNQANLKQQGRVFYLSTEFNNNYSSNDIDYKELVAYRGILNREPDQSGYDYWNQQLHSGGVTWDQFVDQLFDSSEFATLVAMICNTSGNDPAAYQFGTQAAPTIPTTGSGFGGGSGFALQRLLNSPENDTVDLQTGSLTTLTFRLTIPTGKTLQTNTLPGTNSYGKMGRIVRAAGFLGSFSGPAILLQPGAKLKNVWYDGQLGTHSSPYWSDNAEEVKTGGGAGTIVQNNRLGNARGRQPVLRVEGNSPDYCAPGTGNETIVTGNVLTGYQGAHYQQGDPPIDRMVDGIQVACENAIVQNNTVIDASDVGIILFYTDGGHVQKSRVMGNLVVNTGNSAYSGVAVSGEFGSGIDRDFTGSALSSNILWTSNRAHMDLAVGVGSRACVQDEAANTNNPTVQNNLLGLNTNIRVQADEGIAVSGAYNVMVTGNGGWLTQVDTTECPNADPFLTVAAVTAGKATGSIQGGRYVDADVYSCLRH